MNHSASDLVPLFERVLQLSFQASILVFLVIGAQWLLGKRISARWRHSFWWLLILRLIIPVAPTAAWSIFNVANVTIEGEHSTPTEKGDSAPYRLLSEVAANTFPQDQVRISGEQVAPVSGDAFEIQTGSSRVSDSTEISALPDGWSWMRAVAWIWAIVAGLLVTRLVYAEIWLSRRLGREQAVSRGRLLRLLEDCRRELNCRVGIRVFETDLVDRPAVSGIWRKSLLLPVDFAERYSDAELHHMFLHELAHLKRRDIEVQSLVHVLQAIHWFNPVLWWAFGRMRLDREMATDELALSVGPGDGTGYGETIIRVLQEMQTSTRNPRIVGIAEDKAHLGVRLRSIVNFGRIRRWRGVGPIAILALASVALTDAIERDAERTNDEGSRAAGETLIFKVVNAESGELLSDAVLTGLLSRYSGAVEEIKLEGDSTGTINWEFDPDDLSRMDYSIQHEGLITISGSWKNQELEYLPEFLSVELPRGTSIGGTVLDEAGDPIEGVDIVFERRRNHGLDNSNSPIRDRVWLIEAGTLIARTGHEGLWQAPCIHPRLSWAAIRLRHPDYADAVYSTDLTKEMESMGLGRSVRFEEMASLKLVQVLEKGIEISGRVVNEEGKPQPGAKVLYADRKADRYRPYLPMRSLPTDAQGRFFLPHQTTRTHYFAVQVMGYAPAIAELDPETGSRTVQLVVSKGRVLTGEVIDHEGLPVPNASISFDDWGVWQGVDWAVTTDDAGLFRWENAPLDRFQVVIKKPGYVTRYRVLGHEPRQELKIYAPLELSGRVVDAATGVPVDQFRLVWSEGHDVFSRRFARIERGGRYSVHVGEINASGWFGGYAHHFQLRVEAEGYQSKLSRLFDSNKGDVGKIDYDFHLESVPRLKIVVTDSENHAVVGAEVTLWTPGSRSFLKGAPSFENQQNDVIRHTDAEGRVDLDPVEAAFGLIAVHQKGIAWVEEWNADETIVLSLQPWGRVEGVVREYDHPVPSVSVGGSLRPFSRGDGASLSMSRGETDKFGRFRFEFLPPGKHRFYRSVKMQNGSQPSSPQFVYIEPGKTTQIEIGGGGRRVVGRFEIENPYVKIDWQRDSDSPSIASKYPERPEPVNPSVTYKAWRELPEVVRAFDSRRQYPVRFLPDGSFWIDDVRDGEYMLDFRIYDPRDPDSFSHGRYVGSISQTLDIVSHEGANSEHVIDVGVISVRLKADIQEGETMAPSFKAVDLNDGEIVLADYKGKWVLLDFWATWCAPCLADLPYFRKVHDRFAGRKDFVMISLSLDSEVTDVTKFLEKNDLPWLHGYLGPMRESSVAREFGVDGIPAVFLVNPNGKIIAKRLRGGKIEQTVSKYLADSSQILTN